MNRIVVLQSAYIPWKGYFHLMEVADTFIFHDDLQYTHSDWRSRNRIRTESGTQWLSIPAGRDEKRLICEVEVEDQSWKRKHRRTLESNYAKAPCYDQYSDLLDFLYDNSLTNLSQYNQRAIRRLAELLGIGTAIRDSREFAVGGRKTERLIELLTKAGATEYLSGPAGRQYLDARQFDEAGIGLRYFEYPDYPDYAHCQGRPTDHQVSILDLLFHVGPQAGEYIWGSSR